MSIENSSKRDDQNLNPPAETEEKEVPLGLGGPEDLELPEDDDILALEKEDEDQKKIQELKNKLKRLELLIDTTDFSEENMTTDEAKAIVKEYQDSLSDENAKYAGEAKLDQIKEFIDKVESFPANFDLDSDELELDVDDDVEVSFDEPSKLPADNDIFSLEELEADEDFQLAPSPEIIAIPGHAVATQETDIDSIGSLELPEDNDIIALEGYEVEEEPDQKTKREKKEAYDKLNYAYRKAKGGGDLNKEAEYAVERDLSEDTFKKKGYFDSEYDAQRYHTVSDRYEKGQIERAKQEEINNRKLREKARLAEIAFAVHQEWDRMPDTYKDGLIKKFKKNENPERKAKQEFAKAIEQKRIDLEKTLQEKFKDPQISLAQEAFYEIMKYYRIKDADFKKSLFSKGKFIIPPGKPDGETLVFASAEELKDWVGAKEKHFKEDVNNRVVEVVEERFTKGRELWSEKKNEKAKELAELYIPLGNWYNKIIKEVPGATAEKIYAEFLKGKAGTIKFASKEPTEEQQKQIKNFLYDKARINKWFELCNIASQEQNARGLDWSKDLTTEQKAERDEIFRKRDEYYDTYQKNLRIMAGKIKNPEPKVESSASPNLPETPEVKELPQEIEISAKSKKEIEESLDKDIAELVEEKKEEEARELATLLENLEPEKISRETAVLALEYLQTKKSAENFSASAELASNLSGRDLNEETEVLRKTNQKTEGAPSPEVTPTPEIKPDTALSGEMPIEPTPVIETDPNLNNQNETNIDLKETEQGKRIRKAIKNVTSFTELYRALKSEKGIGTKKEFASAIKDNVDSAKANIDDIISGDNFDPVKGRKELVELISEGGNSLSRLFSRTGGIREKVVNLLIEYADKKIAKVKVKVKKSK